MLTTLELIDHIMELDLKIKSLVEKIENINIDDLTTINEYNFDNFSQSLEILKLKLEIEKSIVELSFYFEKSNIIVDKFKKIRDFYLKTLSNKI